jgi:hypothetical protein
MALKKCPECSADVSSSAKTCPHCGKKLRSGLLATVAAVFFALIAVSMVAGTVTGSQIKETAAATEAARVAKLSPEQLAAEQAAKEKEKRTTSAQYACEKFVLASLHDPDGAALDDFYTFPVREEKGGVFLVQVKGRAKNGFGALRQVVVNCRTKSDGKNGWTAVSVKQQ